MWFKVDSIEDEQITSRKGNKVDGIRVYGESVSNKYGNEEKDYWIPNFKEDWVNTVKAACPGKKVEIKFETNEKGYRDPVDYLPLDVKPGSSNDTGQQTDTGGTGGISDAAIQSVLEGAGTTTQSNEQVAMTNAVNLVSGMLTAQERLKGFFKAGTKPDLVLHTVMETFDHILEKLETTTADEDDFDAEDEEDLEYDEDDDIPF